MFALRRDYMLFRRNKKDNIPGKKMDDAVMHEFNRLWNEELLKKVDSRDFSKAYNYAMRKYTIRDTCMRNFFDFQTEGSIRFKEACSAFENNDIFWTYMLIRQFASIHGYSNLLKHLTNKRRIFLSEKRKDTIITRHSVRSYLRNLMNGNTRNAEEFIEKALEDMDKYKELIEKGCYKSAYKIIALTDKHNEYASNIKKFLFYAAKRPVTDENIEQTKRFFEYAGKYYNFQRKKKDGSYVLITDIDIILAKIVFMRNGGDVDRDDLIRKIHRTVKVYCVESMYVPICLLADYLYQIGETEIEKMVLKILIHYGGAVNEKYKKRYTCLDLMYQNSNRFIFRHPAHTPIECVLFNKDKENFSDVLKRCINKNSPNSWCIAVKHSFKTYEFNYKYFYDDRLLSTLESVLDNEFGDYVLEYSIRTFFSGDSVEDTNHSMIIITSGKNQYTDFPKIGMMIKLEPISKKLVNVHYCILYLPEETYNDEQIAEDGRYVQSILDNSQDSRFNTFSSVVENLTWSTVEDLLTK